MGDDVNILFRDGKGGRFQVIGIEASSYVLQYHGRNDIISIPKQDTLMISKYEMTNRNVSLDRNGNTCVVSLRGRFDYYISDEWQSVLKEVVKLEPRTIIIDCDELDSISSSGLGLLISAYKMAKDLLCSFSMRNVKGQTLNALKDTRLDVILMGDGTA